MSQALVAVIRDLKETPQLVIPILRTLHSESAALSAISKVDLKHLTSRSLNLCRSNEPYAVWCGVNILNVLVDNYTVLAQDGAAFFGQLLKILTHTHHSNTLRSTVQCLEKMCRNIRGKPTLTREVLTPNLAGMFTGYLEQLHADPLLVLPALRVLIQEHPTTSRPFANKLKEQLLAMVAAEETFVASPAALRREICQVLACLPVIEKEGPDQFWLRDVNRLIANTASTMGIYASFLQVGEDQEAQRMLKRLADDSETHIFPPLRVDVNHLALILAIARRVAILLELLGAYMTSETRFAVPVPLGKVLMLADLITSFNTGYLPFMREIRDADIQEQISASLTLCHELCVVFLALLPAKYGGSLIPHLADVLAALELLVFLQSKRLNHARILANEPFACQIISCARSYLSLVSHFPHYPAVSKIVEMAVFLLEPRASAAPEKTASAQHSKAAKKKAKRTQNVADLMSHELLFLLAVPTATQDAVYDFFAAIFKIVPIAATLYNKIVKLVIVESVKNASVHQHAAVPASLKRVVLAALLHPAPEAASILPIACTLLPREELLSVFKSPRFPPLPVLIKSNIDYDDESADELEPPIKRMRVEEKPAAELPETAELPEKAELPVENAAPASHIFTSKPVVEEVEVEEKVEVVQPQAAAQPKEAEPVEELSDDGSEIEIPELDMSDSDEE